MKKKLFYFILISITIFIFALLYTAIFNPKSYTPPETINKKFKQFTAKDLFTDNENKINDLIYDEKITIINIWASWCLPCRNEHVYLMKLKENPKINLIGLNYKDDASKAKFFLNNLGNPFFIVLKDPDGTISIDLGAYGVPETFIIDSEFNIIKKFIGELTSSNYKEITDIVNR
tara:strand:+ start:980 stop:1504 length:525 start_codon:yes stop_codon:yes gene_type:complete